MKPQHYWRGIATLPLCELARYTKYWRTLRWTAGQHQTLPTATMIKRNCPVHSSTEVKLAVTDAIQCNIVNVVRRRALSVHFSSWHYHTSYVHESTSNSWPPCTAHQPACSTFLSVQAAGWCATESAVSARDWCFCKHCLSSRCSRPACFAAAAVQLSVSKYCCSLGNTCGTWPLCPMCPFCPGL